MDLFIEKTIIKKGWNLMYFDNRYAIYSSPANKSEDHNYFKLLSRWNSSRKDIENTIKQGNFEKLYNELKLLKSKTIGHDNYYQEVIVSIYKNNELSVSQKTSLEKLFDQK